jgi:hypothetical protein
MAFIMKALPDKFIMTVTRPYIYRYGLYYLRLMDALPDKLMPDFMFSSNCHTESQIATLNIQE